MTGCVTGCVTDVAPRARQLAHENKGMIANMAAAQCISCTPENTACGLAFHTGNHPNVPQPQACIQLAVSGVSQSAIGS